MSHLLSFKCLEIALFFFDLRINSSDTMPTPTSTNTTTTPTAVEAIIAMMLTEGFGRIGIVLDRGFTENEGRE